MTSTVMKEEEQRWGLERRECIGYWYYGLLTVERIDTIKIGWNPKNRSDNDEHMNDQLSLNQHFTHVLH